MTAPAADAQAQLEVSSARKWRWLLFVFVVLLAVLLGVLWSQRTPIAQHFVEQELAARNVRASYSVDQISLRTQRIENLVLGNPAHPDLTAQSVEIDIAYGALIPRVGAIRARGVRLYGQLTDAGVKLGELDKFRDTSSTSPFSMPDIDMTVDDARMRLETPAGPVGIVLNGRGNLRSGFTGLMAMLIRDTAADGCRTPSASAYLKIRMTNGSQRLTGPVRAASVRCGGGNDAIQVAQIAAHADVTLSSDLSGWNGDISGGAAVARASGVTFARPGVDIRFRGKAGQLRVDGSLMASAVRSGVFRAGKSSVEGHWAWHGGGQADAQGRLAMTDVRAVNTAELRRMGIEAGATPVGPLAIRLADGLSALQTGNRLTGQFILGQGAQGGTVLFSALELAGARGSRIALSNDSSLGVSFPSGMWSLEGGLTSSGGGLPEIALRLQQVKDGGLAGQLFMQPYVAGSARLIAQNVRFTRDGGGHVHITGRLRLDGPLPDGFVRGLDMPLTARWGPRDLVVNPACAPLHFSALKIGSLRLDRAHLNGCPIDGGLVVLKNGTAAGGLALGATELSGRLGDSSVHFSAASARYDWSGGVALAGAKIRVGDGNAPVMLAAKSLTGRALPQGVGGEASGIDAQLGTVPLLARDGAAHWSFVRGTLALKGRTLVLDAARPARFNPLESPDFHLTLFKGTIRADGTLRLPGSDRTIATVRLAHRIGAGTGHADIRVDKLRFDSRLQPDEITHTALGVIANVSGSVDGSGRIAWSGDKVTSSGDFVTRGMNFAAAFGPVQGFSTHVHFTDLIELVTAPHQEMRIATVHPGVDVHDGVIHYALLPGQQVAIEDGHWPFSGGELILLPTIMDMSAEKPRHLTFRVLGLDAGTFIQTLELKNISATGTFDGLLPITFDARGGRIVGGILTARQFGMPPLILSRVEGVTIPCDPNRLGGHLAYVGQVSNENLGRLGRLAFDALKDLQYKCLTILMDGALDGEVVTQVVFNGVNRGELSTVPKVVAKQFVGLPFIFNIKISAPFRGLISTAQSFIDPGLLIRQHLGDGMTPKTPNELAVQPADSENMPSGEKQ